VLGLLVDSDGVLGGVRKLQSTQNESNRDEELHRES